VKADPFAQRRLLDLQERDTRLSQIDHRARTLPEAQQLLEFDATLARLRDEIVSAEMVAEDLERDQSRADSDVEQVRERARRDQDLLDSGSIGDPKQLQNLQHELQSLSRRQSELEDVELQIMEQVDAATAVVAGLVAEREALGAERDALAAVVDAAQSELTAERESVARERQALASDLPADLLALYEKIRADQGGVGAAHLHRGQCGGCRLQLPPNELEHARSARSDEIVRCEECRRILVRTEESGLHS
jgi:predicted  nucleic acid-binding Zn-ribbon protein